MRLIFAGTPEFAAVALRALLHRGHEIALVLTQPDRPKGRGLKLAASPVKEVAQAHQLPLLQPASLKDASVQAELAGVDAGCMVVAAYGLLLPSAVLAIPPRGCLNIHASLLPRWRGAAPIQRALLAGDRETGVSIMQMNEGLDTGDILLEKPLPIAPDDTAQSLHDKLAVLGGEAIVEALARLDTLAAQPQDEQQASYAAKLTKAEAQLDWTQPAEVLERAVRAYQPFPIAWTTYQDEPLRVWAAAAGIGHGRPGEILAAGADGIEVASGEGSLILTRLQRPGGKPLPSGAFLQGLALPPGARLR
jgi:methionyl-tRNA formyltransferase